MSTLHEQARAEAEKRCPNAPRAESWANLRAQNAYVDGFLAGHEAATRTRVVTNPPVFGDLAPARWYGYADMQRDVLAILDGEDAQNGTQERRTPSAAPRTTLA